MQGDIANRALIPHLAILFSLLLMLPVSVKAETINKRSLNQNSTLSSMLLDDAMKKDGRQAGDTIRKALQASPDNPALYFALFKSTFSLNPLKAATSINYLFKGINSYRNSFWWFMSICSVISSSVMLSLFLLVLFLATIRIIMDMPLFLHEIREDIRNALYPLMLFSAVLGFHYFLSSLLFLSYVHIKKSNRYTGYLLILIMMFTPIFGRQLGIYLSAALSPELKSVVAANEGSSMAYPAMQLKERTDFASRFSYALALQGDGHPEEAIAVYNELNTSAKDPRVYINMGNSYADMKQYDKAMQIYQESLEITPLPSAYYNMSVIAREKLEFTPADRYFIEAVKMDLDRVTRFRELQEGLDTSILMKETLTMNELLSFALKQHRRYSGTSWKGYLLFVAFSLILLAVLYVKRNSSGLASKCPKCGKVFCSGCEKRLLQDGVCNECFRNMISYETNPLKRIEQLLSSYQHKERRRKRLMIFSFIIPGISLIMSNRLISGLISSLLLFFFSSTAILSVFFTLNISPDGNDWIMVLSVLMLVLTYSLSSIYTIRGIKRGWL